MDTSIGKALIMIAGVLLAMLVIAFINQTFNQTSRWATAQDQEEDKAEIEKFNKEWEVYDKDLMYGVDVISCLNKALSNNDKINRIIDKNGEKYDESYEIKVDVSLREDSKKLKQSITVYYWKYDKDLKKVIESHEGDPDDPYKNLKFIDVPKFDVLNKEGYMKDWANFKADDIMQSLTEEKEVDLSLDRDKSIPGTPIYNLLSFSKIISENKKNNASDSKYALMKLNNSSDYIKDNGWEKVWIKLEFKSYLYDLKTRKFKCTGITYKDSGRVNKISFKEL